MLERTKTQTLAIHLYHCFCPIHFLCPWEKLSYAQRLLWIKRARKILHILKAFENVELRKV